MAYDLTPLRILVVDSSPFRRTLICDVLRALGVYQVTTVSDGTGAYNAFLSVAFDIIITEQVMLPLDGLELARMIRTKTDSPNPVIPVLMIVVAPSTRDIVAARDAGVTEILAMPFSVTVFYSRLMAIIENPRGFVRDGDYFGPDRRRSVTEFLGDDQRSTE
jgi:CheY-like chemotaxis protein